MSHIFFFKLYASDEKVAKSDLRHFDYYLSSLHSVLEKLPSIQRHPYLMKFTENFALFHQVTAFLLLKLAYDQILDLSLQQVLFPFRTAI